MESPPPDGLLAIDKPAGISSHAVADRLRKTLGTRRIGHAGTLDPFATGLLLLLVGRATRLLTYVDDEPKVYRATVRFGTRTATDDPGGEVLEERPLPDQDVVLRALPTLTGDLMQQPPAFSAKRVGGVRAYAAARQGTPLPLPPVPVRVHEWRVISRQGSDLEVEITCGGGTYIRALARDLGRAAGSAAHLAALRRVRAGQFRVEDAVPLPEAERDAPPLRPIIDVLAHLPRQDVSDADARRVAHGQSVPATVAGEVAALVCGNDVVAVGTRRGEAWQPRVVLRDAD